MLVPLAAMLLVVAPMAVLQVAQAATVVGTGLWCGSGRFV
jgi:hypothetical protein